MTLSNAFIQLQSNLEGVSPLKGGISTCTPKNSVLQVPVVKRGTGLS